MSPENGPGTIEVLDVLCDRFSRIHVMDSVDVVGTITVVPVLQRKLRHREAQGVEEEGFKLRDCSSSTHIPNHSNPRPCQAML